MDIILNEILPQDLLVIFAGITFFLAFKKYMGCALKTFYLAGLFTVIMIIGIDMFSAFLGSLDQGMGNTDIAFFQSWIGGGK